MQPYPPTLIYRHRKENLKKCSLRGLEGHPDFKFFTYPKQALPPLDHYFILAVDAPPLDLSIEHLGLLIIDGTWAYAEKMLKQLPSLEKRSLPRHFRTAYPRRQDDLENPDWGLASIEAIYIAYHLLGRPTEGLLDHYHWKELFIEKNPSLSLPRE